MINPFKYHVVCDDLAVLVSSEKTEKPKNWFKKVYIMFRGQAYWEDELPLARMISLSLHLITSALIYFAFGRNSVSLIASLLFLLHPAHTECSIWLSAKGYSFTAMMFLIAWIFPLFSPVLFLTPLMMSISIVFAPLLFIFTSYKWLMILCPITLVLRRTIFSRKHNAKLDSYSNNKEAMRIHPGKIIIAFKFYGYYIYNTLLGNKYCFYHKYMSDFLDSQEGIKNSTKLDGYFLIGVATASVLIYSFLAHPTSLFTIGLAWASINIAMWCNFISTGQQYIANRYYYLPNIGLLVAFSSVLEAYPLAIGIVAGLYLRNLIPSIKQFKNVYWFFFYQIYNEPDFYFSWINMGNLSFARKQFRRAIGDYSQAVSLAPNNFKALFNLSSAYLAVRDVPNAYKTFEMARKTDVYGQEDNANTLVANRMILINELVRTKGKMTLTSDDLPVIS